MNEKNLVNVIVAEIKLRYPSAWVLKTHGGGMQRSGIPDLLVCIDGKLIGLEVKYRRPGESEEHAQSRATQLQRYELAQLERAGAVGGVVTSTAAALKIIQEIIV